MENLEELAGDLELVIGVKPHPHNVDTAQFGCDQVLHCVHAVSYTHLTLPTIYSV